MSVVDEVKARLDIVDVVGQYVKLQKAGRQFKGLCPFHTEKTPSFIVNPDRQTWHCFGACSAGGDVLAFVGRKENLDFPSTLRLLAERAGVEMEERGQQREEHKQVFAANEAAALYYHNLLLRDAPEAMRYLEDRGLDRPTIDSFHLGYSPSGWDGLREHLLGRGFTDNVLLQAGLLVEGDRAPYDRFRERLMFPIRDERGRVVGFGARAMPGSDAEGGKYINTPQTPIFDKGGLLYALDRAREEMRTTGRAVIVEGYMDVIAAHQHGFRNVVASMGTSITERQAGLLQRHVRTVVLAMDADEAGNAAALRGVQVVAAAAQRTAAARRGDRPAPPLEVRVSALPAGVDPDELVRADPGAWSTLVATALPVVDHLLGVVRQGLDLSQPTERSTLVEQVLPAIGEVSDPVMRAHYLQRLSRLARVSEDALRRQLTPARPSRARREEAEEASNVRSRARRAPAEEYCLAMLYRVPEVEPLSERLDEQLFSMSENRELYRLWLRKEPIGEDSPVWEHYSHVFGTRLLFAETSEAQAAFLNCVDRLEEVRMKSVKEASALALAEEEAGIRPGQVAAIARTRWEAKDAEDATDDAPESAVADRLLEDMAAGQRFHQRLIEKHRHEPGKSP